MKIERKYIDLKDLKVIDEGSGIIEGYRSVHSEIDEGGDLIVKGFFAESLEEYLSAGFSAHSHDWTFKEAVGFPVTAAEDDHGLFVRSQFHSTSDAQDIRTKCKERMEAGKKVGFSFGYSVTDKSYIEAKDYKEQLPLFVRPERLQANLLKAQKFDRIRILKKGEIIEDSIVTAPMNKLANATGVKSETKAWEETDNEIRYRVRNPDDFEQDSFKTITLQKSPKISAVIGKLTGETSTTIQSLRFPADVWAMADAKQWVSDHADELKCFADYSLKGMLAEQMAQTTPSTWEVESALRRVLCKIAETAKTSDVTGVVIDWKAKVTEAINEYPPTMIPLVISQIEEFLNSSDDEFYLKDVTGSDRFESFEDAGTALEKFAQKMRSNHEVRLKEGRMLSASNRAKVQACMDKIMELHTELSDLMAMSEPKPKETETEKQIDLVVLRAQSARQRNHALRTLARIA